MQVTSAPSQMEQWVRYAHPGTFLLYHEGYLPEDKGFADSNTDIVQAANFAWRAYELGRVRLVQKRLGEHHYQYFMVKRRQR